MFLFGFAVIGGPEIITINNDVARMNTVFKFWLQGWLFRTWLCFCNVSYLGLYQRSSDL